MCGGWSGNSTGGRNSRVLEQLGGKVPALAIVRRLRFTTNFPDLKGSPVLVGLLWLVTVGGPISRSMLQAGFFVALGVWAKVVCA